MRNTKARGQSTKHKAQTVNMFCRWKAILECPQAGRWQDQNDPLRDTYNAVYKIVLSVFLFSESSHIYCFLFFLLLKTSLCVDNAGMENKFPISPEIEKPRKESQRRKENLPPAKNSFLPSPHCPTVDFFLLVSEPTDVCYSPSQE